MSRISEETLRDMISKTRFAKDLDITDRTRVTLMKTSDVRYPDDAVIHFVFHGRPNPLFGTVDAYKPMVKGIKPHCYRILSNVGPVYFSLDFIRIPTSRHNDTTCRSRGDKLRIALEEKTT